MFYILVFLTTFSSWSFFHSYYFHLGDMKWYQLIKMFLWLIFWSDPEKYSSCFCEIHDRSLYFLIHFSWRFSFLSCAECTIQKNYWWFNRCFSSMYWALHALSLSVEGKYAVNISCLHIASGLLSNFHTSLRTDLWYLFYSYIIHMPFRHVPKSSTFCLTVESPVLIFLLHIYTSFLKYSALLYICCYFDFQDLWALFSIMLLHWSLKEDCKHWKVVIFKFRDIVMVICGGPIQKWKT